MSTRPQLRGSRAAAAFVALAFVAAPTGASAHQPVFSDDVICHSEMLDIRDEPAGPWETVADAIVTAALAPARAGIVVRHLVGAAAKFTPRVARSLLWDRSDPLF